MSEELIARAAPASNIPTHPEGQFPAVCMDLIDLGMVERTWKGKVKKQHRIQVRFFCGEWFDDNEGKQRPLWVDAYFTLSLSEKSALRPFLESWRGQRFTDAELEGFNVAKLYAAPAFVQVEHNPTPQKTYANIKSIMRLPKSMEAPAIPPGYVRVKDRPTENGDAPRYDDDDDMPF